MPGDEARMGKVWLKIRLSSIDPISSECDFSFRIKGDLGSGQFGNVEKGIWATPYGIVDVAVKTLSADGDKVKFLQEAAIMAQFRHPNVVLLHGVVCREKPVSKMQTNLVICLHWIA